MDRREFLTGSAIGAVGLALETSVPWLSPSAAYASNLFQNVDGQPWKFGVMADTQWGVNADGQNPGTCAVDIIKLINAQFIAHGVKFVIQVGDLVDVEDNASNGYAGQRNSPVRAAAAQSLYDAGIGFFPLRGNHEGSTTAANEFVGLYPQSRGMGRHVHGAGEFSSPFAALDGLSYAFDFGNVRFVLLDQFARSDGSLFNGTTTTYLSPASTGPSTAAVGYNIIDQLPWIDAQLAGRKSGTHAFVLGHKNLIGQNHVDCLFGDNPSTNPTARNAFITSLQSRGVRYYMGGHDHMHHRSVVTSPDGTASVKQMICSSDSYKFYYPAKPSNDATYDSPMREISAAQELDTFGFYIFTVDGPRVTVDFYASGLGLGAFGTPAGNENKLVNSPTGTAFYKQETFGYSLNGKEFLVAEGGSYTPVQDSFQSTAARILGGTNQGVVTDASGRGLTKTVNTGWSVPDRKLDAAVTSYILSIWGTADSLSLWNESTGVMPAADRTPNGDTYVLSIGYDKAAVHGLKLNSGTFGVATRDAGGKWVNAVSKNAGGSKQFVYGPWSSGYGLGTYGVDTGSGTVWAVVNHDGDFAAAAGL